VETLAELKDDGIIRHIGLSNVTIDQPETARDIADIATVQNRYNMLDREHDDLLNGGQSGSLTSELDGVTANHDTRRRQVALAWLLQQSSALLPIPGTLNLEHLKSRHSLGQGVAVQIPVRVPYSPEGGCVCSIENTRKRRDRALQPCDGACILPF
jgi:aryl-alcohol dehydrogenase-like predicted oxidoreductase